MIPAIISLTLVSIGYFGHIGLILTIGLWACLAFEVIALLAGVLKLSWGIIPCYVIGFALSNSFIEGLQYGAVLSQVFELGSGLLLLISGNYPVQNILPTVQTNLDQGEAANSDQLPKGGFYEQYEHYNKANKSK